MEFPNNTQMIESTNFGSIIWFKKMMDSIEFNEEKITQLCKNTIVALIDKTVDF